MRRRTKRASASKEVRRLRATIRAKKVELARLLAEFKKARELLAGKRNK